jgi:hypothetical protein
VAATGRVDHRHADGLFPGQNSTVKCSVRAAPSAGVPLNSAIHLHYSKQARTIEVTALTPVAQALGSLPGACPGQGDSLDGLFDNYFTPGFSFSTHYGPERWFRSKTIEIPASVFHHSARIVIPLADTRASTPPHDCAVPSPAFQLCTTGGAWHGVLTFNRQPPRR